ncbi:hypothetical protein ACMFMG_003087 [Clarireedia jacksonii]
MGESNPPSHTDINRRESVRSARLSMQMPATMYEEEDDDDYALAAMGISDGGYRPADEAHSYRPPQPTQPPPIEAPIRAAAFPPPRPSSMTKPKGTDSFALRHDGGMGSMSLRGPMFASTNNGLARSSSVSTESTIMRPESPYQGPSGPSHPYHMYPQESRLARTASIATTSTVPAPQERFYTGPSGPTHPYGMYPQSTVPESEADPIPVAPIPVGFPGLNNDYQRRLGPEGEEAADLIGPDGHTEQLPPYTKYPENALARKVRPSIQVPDPIAGAGGMGLATRNPEFASREELNSPDSRQSTRSMVSDSSSQHVNAAAMELSEKPQLKKWQITARKKLCNIVPVWVLVLILLMFVLFGIILGGVLGALRPKHGGGPKHHDGNPNDGSNPKTVYATMTSTFDATPLSTVPANLPTLPVGTYQMPITTPSTAQSSCILTTVENSAWSCSIANTPLEMSISDVETPNELKNKEMIIGFGQIPINFYPYGAQPPIISTAQVLTLVNDSGYPGRGPAWFFQMSYNKMVVLPKESLSASSNSKRGYRTAQFMGRKGIAQAGEQPWFCYWNGTLLETFIYVNETSSSAAAATSSAAWAAHTYGTNTYSSNVPMSTQKSGNSSSGGPFSGFGGPSDGPPSPRFLSPYPKIYKVVERRIPRGAQTVPAYCVAHTIQGDGSASPILNSTGQPVTIYLNETEPTTVSPLADRSLTITSLQERSEDMDCGCVWLSS